VTADLLCTFKKSNDFFGIAYKLHPDYNGAIFGKVQLIFGEIWYIYTFPISAVRFSVRSNYPFVGKKIISCNMYTKCSTL
jgi:hypothetical protein